MHLDATFSQIVKLDSIAKSHFSDRQFMHLMRYCETCKVTYRHESINFCLNDGTLLADTDAADTIVIQADLRPTYIQSLTCALTKHQYSLELDELLHRLYAFVDYEELSLDSRFSRFIDQLFEADQDDARIFVERLLRRAELYQKNSRPNPDIAMIYEAFVEQEGQNPEYFLKQSGLL